MGFSNKRIPNDPSVFPAPPQWMVWIADLDWSKTGSYRSRTYDGALSDEGKIRHHFDFASARRAVRWVGSKSQYQAEEWQGKYITDWAIYEWDNATNEWVERFSGRQGENRDDNPLSQVRVKKGEKPSHPIDAALETKAIESILRAVG